MNIFMIVDGGFWATTTLTIFDSRSGTLVL